jgi:signal transduction histidine kinase/phage shock protein PspC (stress-responsive transcriptional regulator)
VSAAQAEELRRDPDNAVVAGVLAGVANRIGADPVVVRIGFVVLAVVTGGLAVLGYALAWALMPSGETAGTSTRTIAEKPSSAPRVPGGWRVALGVGLLTLAALLAFRELGIWWSDKLVWPLVLAASGAALLWRQSRDRSEDERAQGEPWGGEAPPGATATATSQRTGLYRGGFGIALVIGAALLFLSANDALGAARDVALAVVVAILALALILAPFLWRLGRNLADERTRRIRSQERAEVAAHLHDSVLQTLTLMQKRADNPREVATLARRQERELRSWLFGTGADANGASFSSALRSAADEVEDAHGVPVELVAVGDCSLDERAEAVVAAAREALTNAAKFAPEAGPVSVYAEVEDGRIQVFVHDRGPGFEPASVPVDRRGVRESIVGRMERHGGSASIRSAPGEGTEVELLMEAGPG